MLYPLKHDEMDTFKATESQDSFFNAFDAGHVTLATKKQLERLHNVVGLNRRLNMIELYIYVCVCNLQGSVPQLQPPFRATTGLSCLHASAGGLLIYLQKCLAGGGFNP